MKRVLKVGSLIAIAIITIASCGTNGAKELPGVTKGLRDSASYAVGFSLGKMVEQSNISDLNLKELYKAIEDVLLERGTKMELDEANELINKYMSIKIEAEGRANRELEEAFLKKNADKKGVEVLESGLQYIVEREGDGRFPTVEDTVVVNYRGTLIDGTQFDSSYEREEPITLPLNNFIEGWKEGIPYMSIGGKIKLFVPSHLAYGDRAVGQIKANSTLIFEVELLDIKPFQKEEE